MKYTGMDKRLRFWQEPKGNTQTGVHAHTETVETVLVGQWECLCLLFALVLGFHFSLFALVLGFHFSSVYHVKDVLL